MDEFNLVRTMAIAIGGAMGALLRFWLSTQVYAWLGKQFPYGTLTVNILGSFFIGFLTIWLLERMVSPEWRTAILIGFLGAFTTFSTFSLETLNLIQSGEQLKALLNIGLSVGLCLIAVWLGIQLAKQF